MAFRNWMTKKLSKTVEAAVEPVKQNLAEVKYIANSKAGLLANGLRVFVCLVIGWLIMKDDGGNNLYSKQPIHKQEPNSIVINNYILEKEDKH